MTRILFLTDAMGAAGKERQLVEVMKGLEKRRMFNYRVVVLPRSGNSLVLYGDAKLFSKKIYFIRRKIKKDPFVFLKLYNICENFKPHIIFSWERMCSIYAIPIAKARGISFVNGSIQNATINPKRKNRMGIRNNLAFYLSDFNVSNSYAGLRAYNVPKFNSTVIHNGFDFNRLNKLESPKVIKNKFNITTSKVIGMVARFEKSKDFKTFIESAIEIVSRRNDITFLAVGDGTNARGDKSRSTFDKCQKLVPKKFKTKIIFTGRQSGVESIVNIFDIGVLLTNQNVHGEGISNSIMEYMALAKPVIATRGGGTPEIVKEGITGFMVPPFNQNEVVNKINYLLDNPKIAKEMGKCGRRVIEKEFNLDIMTDNFIKFFNSISNG